MEIFFNGDKICFLFLKCGVGGIYFSPPFLTNNLETFSLPFRIIKYNGSGVYEVGHSRLKSSYHHQSLIEAQRLSA